MWVIGSDVDIGGMLETPVLWFIVKNEDCNKSYVAGGDSLQKMNLEGSMMQESENSVIDIHPNPGAGAVMVERDDEIIGRIHIENSEGRSVGSYNVNTKLHNLELAKGVYFIHFLDIGITRKIVIL